jgi:chromosome segregation ATPase
LKADPDCKTLIAKAQQAYDGQLAYLNQSITALQVESPKLAANVSKAKAAYDQEVDLCKTPAPPADCDEKTKELKTALDGAKRTQQLELTRLNTAINYAEVNVKAASQLLAWEKSMCPQPAGLVTLKADPDCKAELAAAEQQYKDALAAQTAAVDALTTESKTLASNVSKAAATHDADASDYNHKVAADATAKNNANKAKNDMANAQAAYDQEVDLCKTPAPPADCDEKKKELKAALANATSAKKEADDALAAADLAEENAKKAMDDAYDALVSAQAYQVKELARLNEAIQTAGDNVAAASSNLADVKARCPQPAGRVTSVALSR